MRNQSFYHNNRFYNGQVDMLLALTDIGPGDGGTMLIPARSVVHTTQQAPHPLRPNPRPQPWPASSAYE